MGRQVLQVSVLVMCSPGPGLVLPVSRLRWMLLQTVCLTSDSGSRVSLSCLPFPGGAWHAGSCAQGPGLLGGLPSVLLAELCLPEAQPWVPSCQFDRLVWYSRGCPKANPSAFDLSTTIRPVLFVCASPSLSPCLLPQGEASRALTPSFLITRPRNLICTGRGGWA